MPPEREQEPKPTRFGQRVRSVLVSDSLIEKISLLVLTALLTGLLVPAVTKALDSRRARNNAILDSQAKLLSDISETVLMYETLALDVSWFGTPAFANADLQRQAFQRYSSAMPNLIARWRILTSRARAVAPPGVASNLDQLLQQAFVRQDTPTVRLFTSHASPDEWNKQHDENERQLAHCNQVIAEIAAKMHLTNADLR
jgi:hypothetical protein